jgi:REP element-mobilizing transposase RayT
MPDHLHLLVRPGFALGDFVWSLKSYTTRQIQALGRPGKLWQDDYYEHILRKAEEGQSIATYILHNPVRRGLAEVAEAYPWSELPDSM